MINDSFKTQELAELSVQFKKRFYNVASNCSPQFDSLTWTSDQLKVIENMEIPQFDFLCLMFDYSFSQKDEKGLKLSLEGINILIPNQAFNEDMIFTDLKILLNIIVIFSEENDFYKIDLKRIAVNTFIQLLHHHPNEIISMISDDIFDRFRGIITGIEIYLDKEIYDEILRSLAMMIQTSQESHDRILGFISVQDIIEVYNSSTKEFYCDSNPSYCLYILRSFVIWRLDEESIKEIFVVFVNSIIEKKEQCSHPSLVGLYHIFLKPKHLWIDLFNHFDFPKIVVENYNNSEDLVLRDDWTIIICTLANKDIVITDIDYYHLVEQLNIILPEKEKEAQFIVDHTSKCILAYISFNKAILYDFIDEFKLINTVLNCFHIYDFRTKSILSEILCLIGNKGKSHHKVNLIYSHTIESYIEMLSFLEFDKFLDVISAICELFRTGESMEILNNCYEDFERANGIDTFMEIYEDLSNDQDEDKQNICQCILLFKEEFFNSTEECS